VAASSGDVAISGLGNCPLVHGRDGRESTMTTADLVKEVLQGVLLIVGEYRGSHAEMAGYVDKKYGTAIQYVRAIHIVECSWHGHLDRVIITEKFPETFTTAEQAAATFNYVRGRKYVFYIEAVKRERGQTLARMAAWGGESIEGAEDGDGSAVGGPAPP
jgi:hypothetical protein